MMVLLVSLRKSLELLCNEEEFRPFEKPVTRWVNSLIFLQGTNVSETFSSPVMTFWVSLTFITHKIDASIQIVVTFSKYILVRIQIIFTLKIVILDICQNILLNVEPSITRKLIQCCINRVVYKIGSDSLRSALLSTSIKRQFPRSVSHFKIVRNERISHSFKIWTRTKRL